MERHPGKAYMRMGIVLGAVKGRDLSERLLPRQRGAIMGLPILHPPVAVRRAGGWTVNFRLTAAGRP